jgi:hypothetical protein
MKITFQAIEDIKKGEYVNLNIDTGELSTVSEYERMCIDSGIIKPGLQPKEEPNIIEVDHVVENNDEGR